MSVTLDEVNEPTPTAVDLFAGAGGVTAGLKAAGFRVLAAVENDVHCCDSYAANHPEVELLRKDIRSVSPADLATERLTLLTACPPCQGFSSLGRAVEDDERNDLVHEVYRFMRALKPEAIALENVPGLARDSRLKWLEARMRRHGYSVQRYLLCATTVGVPQRRRRLVVLAIRGYAPRRIPQELARPEGNGETTNIAAWNAIQRFADSDFGGDPLHRWRQLRPLTLRRVQAVPVGGSRADLPETLVLDCHRRLKTTAATGSYGRVPIDQPSATMTTRCTTPSCGAFIHPTLNRGLSLREAAALQTFPHDYQFVGGYDAVERQIGNAVPVRLAQVIGASVLALTGAGRDA